MASSSSSSSSKYSITSLNTLRSSLSKQQQKHQHQNIVHQNQKYSSRLFNSNVLLKGGRSRGIFSSSVYSTFVPNQSLIRLSSTNSISQRSYGSFIGIHSLQNNQIKNQSPFIPIYHQNRYLSTSSSSSSTSLFASNKKEIFHHGDKVQFVDSDGTNCEGSITQRKGGWYTVQVLKGDSNDDVREVKKRASQLKKVFSLSQTPMKVDSFSSSSSSSRNANAGAGIDINTDMNTAAANQSQSKDIDEIISSSMATKSLDGIMKSTIIEEEQILNIPEIPTVINLDAAIMNQISSTISTSNQQPQDKITNKKDLQYIQQCIEFSKYDKWVMFTDLHCSPTTLNTCIHVLDTVHKVAKERNAGVLFLGDFWHHRGSVRVDCLNAILNALSGWEVPMIMIPGNHDQVTLSGLEHALTPLQNAYRISTKSSSSTTTTTTASSTSATSSDITTTTTTLPGILIFSHPTKFHNAMFVPHIRDITSMQSVLQSKVSSMSSAIFVHADVTGAYMNDLIISSHGVSPAYFPPNVPIYSGHFHKPHMVNQPVSAPGVKIRYVGSPYETTLSEAGQDKALLVLDANNNWNCLEELPLNVGKKHWRATSIDSFLSLEIMDYSNMNDSLTGPVRLVSPGDRVVVSVDQIDLEIHREDSDGTSDFDAKVKALRSFGATVEIRETKSIPSFLLGENGAQLGNNLIDLDWLLVEDMLPKTTWSNFVHNEVKRETLTNNTAMKIIEAGNNILDELDDGSVEMKESDESVINSRKNAMLDFDEISIEGFGPFKEPVSYPLKERGLVLVKGSNQDVGSDSNGTGKSSLVMSALWALTGSIDARPAQDDKVSDIINDESTAAKVTIRGTIDNTPFVIARSKTKSRGSLTFFLGDEDLTRQSAKETQLVIDEKLGSGPHVLSRTVFHGQHAINGLLEATDTKLKDELSLIVSLKIWQDGASMARKKGRLLSKKVSELDGMLHIREKDLVAIERKYTSTQESVEFKEQELKARQEELHRIKASLKDEDDEIIDLDAKRKDMDKANHDVKTLEEQLQTFKVRHQHETNPLRLNLTGIDSNLQESMELMRKKQREHDRYEAVLVSARETFEVTKAKWGITDTNDIENFEPPEVCPTCKQSTSDNISHANMVQELMSSMNDSKDKINSSLQALDAVKLHMTEIENKLGQLHLHKEIVEKELQQMEEDWEMSSTHIHHDLEQAKSFYSTISNAFASDLQRLESQNKRAKMVNKAEADVHMCRNNLDMLREMQDSTKSELDDMTQSVESIRVDREMQKEMQSVLAATSDCLGARGVQTFVLQNTILALQLVSQSYLDELSDGTLRLQLKLDEGERITRTVTVSGPDGTWLDRPLASLSGGQWRRCSLALSLGFSDLIARRGRLCSSLLVFDEPLTHLDSNGRDNVGRVLRKVMQNQTDKNGASGGGGGGLSVSTIIMILQDLVAEELGESFDRIDEVVRSKGKSTVVVDH